MFAAFAPIWILTSAGYAIRRFGLIDASGAVAIARYVFYLAMPATLFLTLSTTPLAQIGGRPLIASAASTAAIMGAAWLIARRWLRLRPGEQIIWSMSAGYVNSANLGIPIARQVLGSTSYLVQILLLQLLIVSPVILTMLDRSVSGSVRLRQIATLPLRNPVILGSALGVLASATGYRPPAVVHASLALLGASAVPTALIALGAALHTDRPTDPAPHAESAPATEPARDTEPVAGTEPARDTEPGHRTEPARDTEPEPRVAAGPQIALVTGMKLALQPAVAWAIGLYALHLTRPQLLAVTICAGLPTAQNVFIFAQEYRTGASQASRAVLVTTTLSLASLALIAWLLGR
jgi:malonate transporter and related proteins